MSTVVANGACHGLCLYCSYYCLLWLLGWHFFERKLWLKRQIQRPQLDKSLSYNAAALPGSLFVNNAINGAVETLAYVVLAASMPFIGRKKLTSVGTSLLSSLGPNSTFHWLVQTNRGFSSLSRSIHSIFVSCSTALKVKGTSRSCWEFFLLCYKTS